MGIYEISKTIGGCWKSDILKIRKMEEPKVEEVLRNIYDLYENPDNSAKEKASKWLDAFQKSVS